MQIQKQERAEQMYIYVYCDCEYVVMASLSILTPSLYVFDHTFSITTDPFIFCKCSLGPSVPSLCCNSVALCWGSRALPLHSCDNEESVEGQIEQPRGPAEGMQDTAREKGTGY